MDYQNGKIYRLVCNKTGLQYIGSTTQPLYKRKSYHKKSYNQWKKKKHNYVTSFKIVENGDYDIVLIEDCPCDNKEQLFQRERYWIETVDCVNKVIPTRSRKEHYEANREQFLEKRKQYYETNKEQLLEHQKQYYEANREQKLEYRKQYYEKNREQLLEHQKQYHQTNREQILEQKKQHYEANREQLLEHQKQYYETNKEQLLEHQKQYYETNKEQILEKRKQKIQCDCGVEISRHYLSTHRKTKKHQDAIQHCSILGY